MKFSSKLKYRQELLQKKYYEEVREKEAKDFASNPEYNHKFYEKTDGSEWKYLSLEDLKSVTAHDMVSGAKKIAIKIQLDGKSPVYLTSSDEDAKKLRDKHTNTAVVSFTQIAGLFNCDGFWNKDFFTADFIENVFFLCGEFDANVVDLIDRKVI